MATHVIPRPHDDVEKILPNLEQPAKKCGKASARDQTSLLTGEGIRE